MAELSHQWKALDLFFSDEDYGSIEWDLISISFGYPKNGDTEDVASEVFQKVEQIKGKRKEEEKRRKRREKEKKKEKRRFFEVFESKSGFLVSLRDEIKNIMNREQKHCRSRTIGVREGVSKVKENVKENPCGIMTFCGGHVGGDYGYSAKTSHLRVEWYRFLNGEVMLRVFGKRDDGNGSCTLGDTVVGKPSDLVGARSGSKVLMDALEYSNDPISELGRMVEAVDGVKDIKKSVKELLSENVLVS